MADKPAPKKLAVVSADGPSIFVNVAAANYMLINGAFQVQFAEERVVGGSERPRGVDDDATAAIFEIGRFYLTPRAVRMLIDALQVAAKTYEDSIGEPLPNIDQFNAQAAIKTLPVLGQAPMPPSDDA
jgi:hypothetical protein